MDDERLGETVFGLAAIAFGTVIVVGALAGAATGLIALVVHATIAAAARLLHPRDPSAAARA